MEFTVEEVSYEGVKMKSKIKFVVVVGCLGLLFSVFLSIYGQIIQKNGSLEKNKQQKVKKESEGEKQPREEKQELIDTLADEKLRTSNPDKLKETIEKVGQKKIVEAIPQLINLLDFRYKYFWEGTGVGFKIIPEGGDRPAVGALISIGKPTLPALVKVIETEDEDSLNSKNALIVIQTIFFDEQPKGIEFLKKLTLESDNSTKHLRLLKALQKTEELWSKIQK